ncbi:MAG TPA: hypothetical protein PLG72_04395 [Clostridiales bacterium]|nr:hypothetical protein [Clostridiales bacterium]HOL91588.1 hypothetical protein [Clostridiales bacterium]
MDYQKHDNGNTKGRANYGRGRGGNEAGRERRGPADGGFDISTDSDPLHDRTLNGRIVNAESLQIDATLNEISGELKPGETLILDIGNNYFEQTDEIYDTLVLRGYNVRKTFRNGRNQIIVSRGDQDRELRH